MLGYSTLSPFQQTEVTMSSILPSATMFIILVLIILQQTCSAEPNSPCPPSSCGKIHNITHPFRLKGDPSGCGIKGYELDCVNNVTVLNLFSGKYIVQDISYNKYKIRLTDAGVTENTACSIPHYYLKEENFSRSDIHNLWEVGYYGSASSTVVFLNCTNSVTDDHRYIKVNDGDRCDYGGHIYAFLDGNSEFKMRDIKVGCSLEVATFTNRLTYDHKKVSYDDIRRWLGQGFWLSWSVTDVTCGDLCDKVNFCFFNQTIDQIQCLQPPNQCYMFDGIPIKCGIKSVILEHILAYLKGIFVGFFRRITFRMKLTDLEANQNFIGEYVLPIFLIARYLFGVSLLLVLYINIWLRRHVSIYDNIENFLLDNNLNPIRYEYGEIKKMTQGFKVILGQGGFGSVYKGKLRSGSDVAVKMLSKSKTKGQDFISEVATIGRIHHMNVVHLIGYCVDGKKCALVYEYMPNGSLDKYIFSKEGSAPLSYEKIYEISLGVAHGIAYLHEDCDVQILHFDIKPHNILLDENFNPKISDFGLAKLYPTKDKSIILTAIRGTLGYMAPELFYQNIGGVSYKADVYSFGMLLMEMASGRKNSNPHAEHSSQYYFPFWIYDQFKEGKDINVEDVFEEDKILVKKMFIVALWCIQLKPNDRPSMKKVVEMLEGDVESLEIPPKPVLVLDDGIISDQISWSTWSDDSTSSHKNLGKTNYSSPIHMQENNG